MLISDIEFLRTSPIGGMKYAEKDQEEIFMHFLINAQVEEGGALERKQGFINRIPTGR